MYFDPVHDFIRYISKIGDLFLVSDSSKEWARGLSDDEKIALYIRIRDESRRLEEEWRQEFAKEVEIGEEVLPPMLDPFRE